MAYVLGEEVDEEIQSALTCDQGDSETKNGEIKRLFKNHKKIVVKHLNRKWGVFFLENYISQKIIPRGLRDSIIPTEHLHTVTFIPKWKELCISHGIELMKLIVEEEKLQLINLKT